MNNDFKIPQKYLIDFDSLKVGDRVWTIQGGQTTIVDIYADIFPIIAGEDSYTKDGRYSMEDTYPSLFRSNPFEDIREEFFQDTLMEVSMNASVWRRRVVYGKKNGKWLSWVDATTVEGAKQEISQAVWNCARPIAPPSEELVHLTLKDISEGKGKGVPAHLIRIKE